METTKKLSQVRAGETIRFVGRSVHQAATDAEVAGQRVAVSWVGGGGCFLADEDVLVLDEALEALRAIPTLAASIGTEARTYEEALRAYEATLPATAPHLHTNFRTSVSAYVQAHQAAAHAAIRVRDVAHREGEVILARRFQVKAEHHARLIAEAWMR